MSGFLGRLQSAGYGGGYGDSPVQTQPVPDEGGYGQPQPAQQQPARQPQQQSYSGFGDLFGGMFGGAGSTRGAGGGGQIGYINQQEQIMRDTLSDQMKQMGYMEDQIGVIIEQMQNNAMFGQQMTDLLNQIKAPGPGTAVHMVGY